MLQSIRDIESLHICSTSFDLLGRTEAARFLLEAGSPAAVYDDMGNSCLSLMVEKMPGIAIEALEQFHSMDRALRKKYYYLNYLEKMSATDNGENSEGSAKTALEVMNSSYCRSMVCSAKMFVD